MLKESDLTVYKKIKALVNDLYVCTEKIQIDNTFAQANIIDPSEKISLLRKCMGIQEVYGIFEEVSPEDDFDFECAVFLEGTWRLLN